MSPSSQPEDGDLNQRIIQALSDLASAHSVAECRSVVESCPYLLTDQGETLLEEFLAEAKARGDRFAFFVRILQHRGELLRQCRELGVEEGFEQATSVNWPQLPPDDFDELVEAEECERHYEETGSVEALDAAVTAWQRVLGSPAFLEASVDLRAVLLHRNAVAFARRYEATGDVEDIEAAICSWERGLDPLPADSPYRPLYLHSLSRGLEIRFRCTSDVSDLHRALAASEEALQLTPMSFIDRPGYLYRVGTCYRRLYEYAGDKGHLSHAITAHQDAIDAAAEDSDELPEYHNALGAALCTRFKHSGDVEDLRRGIDVFRQAAQASTAGWSAPPSCLHNLGNALLIHYRHAQETSDLDEAVDALRRAVELTPQTSQNLPTHLASLGNALSERYALTGDRDDLVQAIAACEKAVHVAPAGAPERAILLSNLGKVLNDQYLLTGDRQALQRTVSLSEEAMRIVPAQSPWRSTCLHGLGISLKHLYQDSKDPDYLVEAVAAFEGSCRAGLEQAPEVTLESCRDWGGWAMQRQAWGEAVRAYKYGMDAVERLYQAQLLRRSKESWLRRVQGLYCQSSLALTLNGDVCGAAVALERGRARMLSEALERHRADLRRLCIEGRKDLYERYVNACERVDCLERQLALGSSILDVGSLKDTSRARDELSSVITEIQRIPGYEDFFRTSTFERIQAAAADYPLVYIALPPDTKGLGLIVDRSGAAQLRFPDMTRDALMQRLAESADGNALKGYMREYFRWRESSCGEVANSSWPAALEAVTQWLWDALIGLLVAWVVGRGYHRVALIPMGFLGILPLHAAWTLDSSRPTGRRYALDDVCFSYAPNARGLLRAAQVAAEFQPSSLLAVTDPAPTSAPQIPGAAWEADVACSYFPSRGQQVLSGSSASRGRVLEAIPWHTVHHFACHAEADWSSALGSGLLMAQDQKLSVADLLDLRLKGSRLAVLSACETGIFGGKLPDEVIGLPIGLLQAGVAGVVGSLWAVNDFSTALLMMRFYEAWRVEGGEPPEALRTAQNWLRASTNAVFATYFKQHLPEFGGGGRLPVEIADFGYKRFALANPDVRPFAHPFYWAGFYYTGV